MVPIPEGTEWLTVKQTAEILGLHVQSVYDALKQGRMEARGTGHQRRVHAREVMRYAMVTGKDGDTIITRMETVIGEIDWEKVLQWVLAGAGLYLLLKYLKK